MLGHRSIKNAVYHRNPISLSLCEHNRQEYKELKMKTERAWMKTSIFFISRGR